MKKIIAFIFVAMFGFAFEVQTVSAQSYEPWIVSSTSHFSSENIADIIAAIYQGKVKPNIVYQVEGISFRIPHPDLYLRYIEKCVKKSDPNCRTTEDVVRAIQNGDAVRWGNDISYRVKNYYYSSLHNRVSFNSNYSGAEAGVWVLLINGIPTIKLDCGNPLEYESGQQLQATTIIGTNLEFEPRIEPTTKRRIEFQKPIEPMEDDSSFKKPLNYNAQSGLNMEDKPQLDLPVEKESFQKKSFKVWWVAVPVSAIGAGIAAYFIIRNNTGKSTPEDEGGRVTQGGHP